MPSSPSTAENLRFRDVSLNFKIAQSAEETAGTSGSSRIEYPTMTKTLVGKKNKKRTFTLHIEGGDFSTSEIIVCVRQRGRAARRREQQQRAARGRER